MTRIFSDQAAYRNPSIIRHIRENRIQLWPTDIIEININTAFNLGKTLLHIFRFIVNGSNTEFFFQKSTFICTTCSAVNMTPKIFGNLAGHHASSSTCSRYQHIFTRFGFAGFHNAPHASPARKAKYTQMLTNIIDGFIQFHKPRKFRRYNRIISPLSKATH